MLENYFYVLLFIDAFRDKKIDFEEFRSYIAHIRLGDELGFEDGDWSSTWEAWLEYIEYTSPSLQYKRGCSICDFLEHAIEQEPRPLRLPENDEVVRLLFTERHSLIVYFDQPASLIRMRMAEVMKNHKEIFSKQHYQVNPVSDLDQVEKYFWEDFGGGFEAVSGFFLHERRPAKETKITEMISLLKSEFSDVKIGILMDEYTLV